MITVIVEFALPQPMTPAQAQDTFLGSAPKYQGMAGLIRKYYWLSEDGTKAGGIYLWASRADAERVYTDDWKAFVRGRYGADPKLTWVHTPVVVDNLSNQVVTGD